MDVLPFSLLLQAHFFHAFPAHIPGRLRSCVPSNPVHRPPCPPPGYCCCHLLARRFLAEGSEARGWFPLPAHCGAVLLGSLGSVSFPHFSPFVPSMSFCSVLQEAKTPAQWTQISGGSWQRWSSCTDIFIFFLISGKHDPFSPKAPDVMPYLLSFLPPLTTASLPVLHFNCWRGSSLSVLGKLTSALSSLHEHGSSQPLVTSCLPEVPAQYQPMSLPEVC